MFKDRKFIISLIIYNAIGVIIGILIASWIVG